MPPFFSSHTEFPPRGELRKLLRHLFKSLNSMNKLNHVLVAVSGIFDHKAAFRDLKFQNWTLNKNLLRLKNMFLGNYFFTSTASVVLRLPFVTGSALHI